MPERLDDAKGRCLHHRQITILIRDTFLEGDLPVLVLVRAVELVITKRLEEIFVQLAGISGWDGDTKVLQDSWHLTPAEIKLTMCVPIERSTQLILIIQSFI